MPESRFTEGPLLVLVMGVAGTGKTTLSREVVRRTRVVYLANDFIADAFFPDTRRGPRHDDLRPRVYTALYTIAAENLKLGNSVLLDVPHVKEAQTGSWPKAIRHLAGESGAELVVLKCRCSEAALSKRLRERGEARDRWKLENWKRFLEEEPIDFEVPFPHLLLDTERDAESNIDRPVRYILEHVPR